MQKRWKYAIILGRKNNILRRHYWGLGWGKDKVAHVHLWAVWQTLASRYVIYPLLMTKGSPRSYPLSSGLLLLQQPASVTLSSIICYRCKSRQVMEEVWSTGGGRRPTAGSRTAKRRWAQSVCADILTRAIIFQWRNWGGIRERGQMPPGAAGEREKKNLLTTSK